MDIEEFFYEELQPRSSNYTHKMDNTEFKEFTKKELDYTDKLIIKDIDCENRMDHVYDLGWYLYNKQFKTIPCELHLDQKFNVDILEYLKNKGKLIYKRIQDNGNDTDLSEIQYIFFYKEMIIATTYYFNSKENEHYTRNLNIFHSIENKVKIDELVQFEKSKKETPKIGIIKQSKFGPQVIWKDHETENKFSLDNYNDDFSEFLTDITSKLETNKTGLYLCYGEAGTCKSSAIRHLITQIDRRFVFIPPQMINYLSTPEFVDLVLNSLKGSVLIIEDAEKALMKRESADAFHNSELVSSLLNLTDGLYADLAHTSIIATYNCDRNLIDPALLRKGRMKAEYKFNRLSVERSQILMDKLEHQFNVTEPMTLADIFNHEEQYSNYEREERKPKRVVGFGG